MLVEAFQLLRNQVKRNWQAGSTITADVAKLADALDLGSSAERHVGSTPSIRTKGLIPALRNFGGY